MDRGISLPPSLSFSRVASPLLHQPSRDQPQTQTRSDREAKGNGEPSTGPVPFESALSCSLQTLQLFYRPPLHADEIGLTSDKYIPLNSSVTSLPLKLSYEPMSLQVALPPFPSSPFSPSSGVEMASHDTHGALI
jgi:hypothetical protein